MLQWVGLKLFHADLRPFGCCANVHVISILFPSGVLPTSLYGGQCQYLGSRVSEKEQFLGSMNYSFKKSIFGV